MLGKFPLKFSLKLSFCFSIFEKELDIDLKLNEEKLYETDQVNILEFHLEELDLEAMDSVALKLNKSNALLPKIRRVLGNKTRKSVNYLVHEYIIPFILCLFHFGEKH